MDDFYNNHCFRCGNELNGDVYCTCEFDGWICQDCFENLANEPDLDQEGLIIRRELHGF
jgi:recombinational DNA repair protein (RecF pathway)